MIIKNYPDKENAKLWRPKKKTYHLWLNDEYFGKLEEINKKSAIQKAQVIGRLHNAQIWSLNFSTIFNDGIVGMGKVH